MNQPPGKPLHESPADPYTLERMQDTEVHECIERYRRHVADGLFRERSDKELEELISHNWLLKRDGISKGSVSLTDRRDNWVEISAMSVDETGNGMGKKMLKLIREEMRGKFLYALSKAYPALNAFDGAGFQSMGTLKGLQESPIASHLPAHLKEYDTSRRDPYVVARWDPEKEG
jgi:N-acetylglutamate synthase-like GNAT family acetyltransferase